MGASSVQSLSIWDLPKGYSKVCSMPCFTPVVHRGGDTPPDTYSKMVSLGPSDHSCNVTLSSYEVFEKKHGMECTTAFSGPVWRSKRCWRRMWVWHVLFACIGAGCLTSSRGRHLQGS